MKHKIGIALALAALIAGLVVYTAAQGPPRGPGGPPPPPPPPDLDRMAADLGLTDAQKAQIKTILDTERTALAPLDSKFEDLHQQIEAATANGQFDEATVRNLANQQAQLMVTEMVEHERTKAGIYNVLTPDQRSKAESLRQRHRPGGPGCPGMPPPPPPRPNDGQ